VAPDSAADILVGTASSLQHRLATLIGPASADAAHRSRDGSPAASASDARFAFLDFGLVLPVDQENGTASAAWGAGAYTTGSHGARSRHAGDEKHDDAVGTEEQQSPATLLEKGAVLVAGATSLWSLRLSGLLASVFASRPLWTHIDPILLLPPADDDPEPVYPKRATDDEAAKDELAAARLLEDVGPARRES
jgi:hypothetical protein